jgi:integrase
LGQRVRFVWVSHPTRGNLVLLCTDLTLPLLEIIRLYGWRFKIEVSFFREKTSVPVIVHLGKEALNLLKDLPAEGFIFPYLASVRANDRATEFRSRCRQLGIKGVTLHSYRYAWAERAKVAGMPERFAQEALGHNSKAVHRAYARLAQVKIPSLEEYERKTESTTMPLTKSG